MNEKQLKFGDEVLVGIHTQDGLKWEKSIFIKYGNEFKIICVEPIYYSHYKDGSIFQVGYFINWRTPEPKPEPKYRPYNKDEAPALMFEIIRNKKEPEIITGIISVDCRHNKINFKLGYFNFSISEKELLEEWEFLRGESCGVKENE